uniref:Putative methyltransferase n=1 Tax=viral metagenome TaxID=1070528 RepID=A0A6M3LFQ2_9ZZZZ
MTVVGQKRDGWFPRYQQIDGVRRGKRKLASRMAAFDPADFAGKSVLDLGCNLGQMSLYAFQCGATRVLGVEYDKEALRGAMHARNRLGAHGVKYKLDDLDNPLFWHHLATYDTVLLLSVVDTQELENPAGIIAKACMKCSGVMYLEGHTESPRAKYFRQILDYTDFTQVEHVGMFDGRDVFRCSRTVLDTAGFYGTLRTACERFSRIVVVGNQMSGKSSLFDRVRQPGFTVLDDCDDKDLISSSEKLILFDHRAAQYDAGRYEVLFHVVQPEQRYEFRRYAGYRHSSGVSKIDSLCKLYTVRTY